VSFNSHDALLEKALPTPCSDNCLSSVSFTDGSVSTCVRSCSPRHPVRRLSRFCRFQRRHKPRLRRSVCYSPLATEHRGIRTCCSSEVQATASGTWYPGATRQWLPRLPSRECNSLMNSFGASQKLRQQRLDTQTARQYGHDLHARDQRRTESELRRNLATQFGEFGRYTSAHN